MGHIVGANRVVVKSNVLDSTVSDTENAGSNPEYTRFHYIRSRNMVVTKKRIGMVAAFVLAVSASTLITACASQQSVTMEEPEAVAETEETDATSASTDTGEW